MTSNVSAHSDESLRVGVIGLGAIGAGVAVSLARRGRIPTVFDIRPDASVGLKDVPAQVNTPGAVAQVSDVVLVAVVTAEQVREVLIGRDGVLAVGRPGLVVVVLSTVSLPSVRELAALCAERDVVLIDAAVSGGARAADNGLVVMVGGPDAVIARVAPVLEDFGKAVVHCGDVGAGMVTKLARNALTYSSWAAVREAASIAAAGGVPLDRLLQVFDEGSDGGTDPLTMLRMRVEGRSLSDDVVASIDALAQKDLGAAQQFAGEAGIETPIVDVTRPRMAAVLMGELPEELPVDRGERGRVMMDRVYGSGFSSQIPQDSVVPALVDTVEHLFAEVWGRAHLSLRDRRLLVLGATAMTGRGDLLDVQLRGALSNGEFTVAQMREITVMLSNYCGPQNGTSILGVVEKLIAEVEGAA
ncbi:NAD(P)-binding domain-containing protein [Rhodococcus sp. IEGM 1366]|uniref:NAD(P)-binding domain-containing protein n=1 Tax=Rhodococcus sp. IEGM 1366 TaxID=3082223 RepID=UPI002954F006|nr:NAD(P)-binding domain-containing protein [Rhodococcus sp. IEGM 1366]MDV8070654.1 NAD(P)-binding domain-containing protein [Rhodococcus sp. IEGM 1366]